ncbi:MAG: hypothetical protein ABIH11_05245 [Candidatus Altiarchaeota archaeon]
MTLAPPAVGPEVPGVNTAPAIIERVGEKPRARLILLVHPFFETNTNAGRTGVVDFDLVRDRHTIDRIEEEYAMAPRMLDRIRDESRNHYSRLIVVSHTVTEHDFEMLKMRYRDGMFEENPIEGLNYMPVAQRKKQAVRREGFEGQYNELWLIAQAMRIMGPERVSIYYKSLNNSDINGIRGSMAAMTGRRPEDAVKDGCAMGTFTGQCVKHARSMIADGFNMPYDSITLLWSSGVDKKRPTGGQRERWLDITRDKVEESLPPEEAEDALRKRWWMYARRAVRRYRTSSDNGRYTSDYIFQPGHIKTMLLKEGYMEDTFGKYRIDGLERTLKGEKPGADGVRLNFPAKVDIALSVSAFLRQGRNEDTNYGRREEWQATQEEVRAFRVKLASYLAGSPVPASEVQDFGVRYHRKLSEIVREGGL